MMKKMLLFYIQMVLGTQLLFGCTQWSGRPYMGWNHMMGYGGYGGVFMWLIFIIIVGIVIYFVFERSKGTGNLNGQFRETPIDILKKRYARGEISKEEFDRLKKDIES